MAGGGASHNVDVLRKGFIVTALVFGYSWLNVLAMAPAELDPRGLLALGFVILAAFTVGELVEVIKLPHITGYLLAGLVLGPSTAHLIHEGFPDLHLGPPFDEGVLNERVKEQLLLLDDLALALIALTAGGELKLESLRTGIRRILGIAGGQIITLGVAITAFVWLISGPIPALALPQLTGLGTTGALAVGTVVAAIALATSPAATIAVINSTGAKGETTTTVLSVVVLKDVLVVMVFSAATAVATGVLGLSGGEGGFLASLGHIVWSVAMGAVIGGVLHLYLRFVRAELLLFLVGLIYAATFLCHQWHLEAALVFIAAGFVTSNFSDLGDALIHEVERLSLPVYVVFFTLAGAKLHLDVLWAMAAFALTLVAIRMAAIYAGTRAGAALAGGSAELQRYGWMGFVSQAGLAITLATSMLHTYPGEVGEALFSLVLGGVAINEMVGPVMLQWGLGFAGEVGEQEQAAAETRRFAAAEEREPTSEDDFWGPPLRTGSPQADEAVADLERELREIVDEVVSGPVDVARGDHEAYLGELRRDFLRGHRRATVAVQGTDLPTEALPRLLRDEVAALGDAWRDRVLDRAARARAWSWSPGELVGVLDAMVAGMPESIVGPVEAESLEPRDEALWPRLRRSLLRIRVRVLGSKREIDLRTLVRYHLSGRGPSRLEGVAALMVNEDNHLAARTSALFDDIARAWEHAAALLESGKIDREQLFGKLVGMRVDVEGDFDAVRQDIVGSNTAVGRRCARVLGHLVRDIKDDVRRVGTVDLPHRHRRYSRVYTERNAGLRALTVDLAGARRTVAARMAAVALDLELVGLEGRVQGALEQHSEQLRRDLRGRGVVQVERADEALGVWLDRIQSALRADGVTARAFSREMHEQAELLEHVIRDAVRTATRLRVDLTGEDAMAGLMHDLLAAAGTLTDWYAIPTAKVPDGDWNLPAEVSTTEVAFREVTVAWIDSRLSRELSNRAWSLADRAEQIEELLGELDRVASFNVELAGAELDVLDPDAAIPAEQRDLVDEMLIGALGRSRVRASKLVADLQGWPEQGRAAIRSAVDEALQELRSEVVDGGFASLGTRLFGEGRTRRLLGRDRFSWSLGGAIEQGERALLEALGPDRVEAARQFLGLPSPDVVVDDLAEVLAEPQPRAELPVVYRRLFSERALEAGDLIIGRESEVAAVSQALSAQGALRTAAVVGLRGTGTSSLTAAVARSWPGKVRRVELDEPVSVETVDGWFIDEDPGTLTVLSGLRWLYELRPGGLVPLERFATRLVERPQQAPWLIHADLEVWHTAIQRSTLGAAVCARVELPPLSAESLAAAVMARHQMSGYDLVFDAAEDFGWQVRHMLLRGTEGEARQRLAWFETLHEASGGVMHDALRLWLASIREVDVPNGLIRVGSVPRPPVARLSALDDEVLLLLVQVLRQGWLDARVYASLFRSDPHEGASALASLASRGLLRPVARGRYEVPQHLRNPVQRALRARGWV